MTLAKEIYFEERVEDLLSEGKTEVELLLEAPLEDVDWWEYLLENYHANKINGGVVVNLERRLE